MSFVLVSDTSILIDLERGGVLTAAFRTSYEIAVPDVLYARELESENGPYLIGLGLRVLGVSEVGVALASTYRSMEKRLSVADTFCLAVAKETGATLLTGDQALRALAEHQTVDCHGLLWFFDLLEAEGVLTPDELHAALTSIRQHPRCRLPADEVDVRLARYKRQ